MKNFPFEYNDETYWYSRSVACSLYYFVFEKKSQQWFILVSQRGPGCPSAAGKWNVPGGYLDFDETLEQAAARECFEETGVRVDVKKLKLASVSTNINTIKQNVSCSYFLTDIVDDIDEIKNQFSFDKNEHDEVRNIRMVSMNEFISNDWLFWKKSMAFNQYQMVVDIFNKRVNIGIATKYYIDTAEKLTKINTNVG